MLLTKLIFAKPPGNGARKRLGGLVKAYERMGKTIMKKIRVLAFLLALLMVFAVFATACGDSNTGDNKEEYCKDDKHNWKKAKIVQKRSCTEPEIKEQECRDCPAKEQIVSGRPSGHIQDESEKTYNYDATCTTDGTFVTFCIYGCTTPEAKQVTPAPGTALGHSYITFTVTADGYSEVAQCVRCTTTTERLLGVKIDMDDRTHVSYSTLKLVTPTATAAPADSDFVKVGDQTYLRVNRPAEEYLGIAEFGVVVYPRADILMENAYVYETTVKLDKAATGDLYLVRGAKAALGQKLNFVTYKQGAADANGTLETLDGTVYNLTDADYADGFTVAVVINDAARFYNVYVNNKLVSSVSVDYGADDYFSGLQLSNIGTVTVHGNTASTFDVESIYIYNANEPNGYKGETNIGYGVYIAENGQRVTYKLGNTDSDHEHAYNNVANTVAATCSKIGYTVKSCECGGELVDDVVAPVEHDFGNKVTIAPTCTEPGYYVDTCKNCGIKNGVTFGTASGHTAGTIVKEVKATCLEDGYTDTKCAKCGVVYTTEYKALGHALGDEKIVVDATCLENGFTYGPCIRCDISYTDPNSIVMAFGHYAPSASKIVKPTCTEGGYDLYECVLCATEEKVETYKKNETPAVGHKFYSFENDLGTKLTTKCINCGYNEEITISTVKPDFNSMKSKLGTKLLFSDYCQIVGYAGFGDLAVEGTPRYAKWENVVNDRESFMRILSAASSTLPSGANSHAHRDFYFGAGNPNTEAGAPVVVEFDVKHPTADELSATETPGAIDLQIGERSSGSLKNFGVVAVSADGTIKANGVGVGKIKAGAWTKIACVFFPAERTYAVYVDGSKMATIAMPDATAYPANFFREIRLNMSRDKVKTMVTDFCNLYMYYGSEPVYLAGAADYEDVSRVEDGIYSNVGFAGDAPNNYNPDAQCGHYVQYFDKSNTGSFMGYKPHTALVIETRGNYKTLNLKAGPNVPTVDVLNKDNKPIYSGTEGTNFDSMLWFGGISYTGIYNVSLDLRFNTNTGAGKLIEGRRGLNNVSDKKANGNARFIFVEYKQGKLWVDGRAVHDIVVGETVRVDVFDRCGSEMFDVYINGYLVAENISYKNSAYGTAGAATANKYVNDQQYLLFDLYSYVTNGEIDVDLDRIDILGGKLAPEYFAGRKSGDVTLTDREETIITKYDENTSITDFIEPSAVGKYLYLQDGVLTKSALNVTAGNLRVTKVGLGGGVDIKDTYPGYYTLGFNDLTTNGKANKDAYDVNGFPGVPTVDEVKFTYDNKEQVAKNVHDLTKYDSITLMYYVDKNDPGYKGMFFLNNPGVTEGDRTGRPSYVSRGLDLTPGWHEVTFSVTSNSGWSSSRAGSVNKVNGYFIELFGWGGTGVDTNGDGNRNESDGTPDGFGFYLHSVVLNKTTSVVAEGTAFTTTEICYDHTFGEAVVEKAPTADAIGFSVETCSNCGFKEVSALPRVTHDDLVKNDPDNHVVTPSENNKPASCEAEGLLEFNCSCGYSVSKVLKKLNHKFVDGQNDDYKNAAPTCTETGKEWYVCAHENCELEGTRYSIDTPALGHEVGEDTITITIVAGTIDEPNDKPLCTDNKELWAIGCAHGCVDENDEPVKWKLQNIAGVAHTYEKEINKNPDCVNVGFYNDVCTECGHVVEDIEIPALGHTAGDNTTLLEVAVGTGESKVEFKNCTDARELWAYGCCVEDCELGADAMWKVEDIEAGEHSYVKSIGVKATCTDPAIMYNVCSHCAYIERDEDAENLVVINGKLEKPYLEYPTVANGHTPSGDVTYFEQSCVSASGRTFVCGDCGETITEYDDNEALGHDFGDWYDVTVADCGNDGFRDKDCSRCDVKYSETLNATEREIECVTGYATGEHAEYTEGVYSSDDEYVVRTKYDECKVCGHQKNIVEIPAKYDANATEGFVFEKGANGVYYLVGYNGEATELVIPGTYSGATVVVAFKNALTNVTKVTLLDGAVLGEGAFKNWTALNTVVLPESVTKIPAYAFSGCTAITEITLPASCTVIEVYAFNGCSALRTVTVKGALTEVQQYAFNGCDVLDRVYYIASVRPDDVIEVNGNSVLFEIHWIKAEEIAA